MGFGLIKAQGKTIKQCLVDVKTKKMPDLRVIRQYLFQIADNVGCNLRHNNKNNAPNGSMQRKNEVGIG